MRKALVIVAAIVLVVVAFVAWPGGQGRVAFAALTKNFACFEPSGTVTVAGLGDSITEGHTYPALNVAANDSYVDLLACASGTLVKNFGVSHETTAQILARTDQVIAAAPKKVLVLAGTNDVIQGETEQSLEHLTGIRAKLMAAGIDPVFGLLPPNNDKPGETMAFNEALRTWAERVDEEMLDYWTPLADPDGTYRDGMDRDGIHPSQQGAKVIAAVAADHLGLPKP